MNRDRALVVCASLVLVLTSTAIAGSGKKGLTSDAVGVTAHGNAGTTVTKDVPVSWTITTAGCLSLPAGTTLNGTGTETQIANTLTDGAVTTMIVTTHGFGTATDQMGNSYVWNYANHFRAANSAAQPEVFLGQMVDHFSLAGSGPSHITAGFLADLNFGPTSASFTPVHVVGDPVSFPDGNAHCDPL